jgi:uncharacterized membrane protein
LGKFEYQRGTERVGHLKPIWQALGDSLSFQSHSKTLCSRCHVFQSHNPLVHIALYGFASQTDLNSPDIFYDAQAPVAFGIPLYPH